VAWLSLLSHRHHTGIVMRRERKGLLVPLRRQGRRVQCLYLQCHSITDLLSGFWGCIPLLVATIDLVVGCAGPSFILTVGAKFALSLPFGCKG